jgi:putative iron-regulated protein
MTNRTPRRSLAALATWSSLVLTAATTAQTPPEDSTGSPREAVQADAARYAFATYQACVERAHELHDAIDAFVATPTQETLAAARTAWLAGREVYGTSEVLRFSDGPIDDRRVGVETFLNAWPIDESYIDGVRGRPDAGIIQDLEAFPHLTAVGLQVANERGGEANVSIGWHAIEFLLWGQDFDPNGPGSRSPDDFVAGKAPFAERRCQYLQLVADLLVQHHEQVRDAWRPGVTDNYRARFLALPADEAIRRILKGMVVLAGFEMSGERLAVAYETRDQEDEHSCFSDNTHRDFITDQQGIVELYRGTGRGMTGRGLREIAFALDPAAAREIDRLMDLATKRLSELPTPFDRLLRAEDGSTEREALLATIETLENEAEALAALGLELGFDIPMVPGQ